MTSLGGRGGASGPTTGHSLGRGGSSSGGAGGGSGTATTPSLLPYNASFCTKEARGGSELQTFLFTETLALLKTAFPRLTSSFLKRRVCAAKSECLALLASGAAGSIGTPGAAAGR